MVTFYQAVCTACMGSDGTPYHDKPHTTEAFARIQRETHDQINHTDAVGSTTETAHVREFEADPIGAMPRETPAFETAEEADVDE